MKVNAVTSCVSYTPTNTAWVGSTVMLVIGYYATFTLHSFVNVSELKATKSPVEVPTRT